MRKSVERLLAAGAYPDRRLDGLRMARRTGETFMPWNFPQRSQVLRLLETSPALAEDESRNDADPKGFHPERESDEGQGSRDSDDRHRRQTMRSAHDEPEESAQNLAAIQRINGEQVKDEEAGVDVP